jgi:hypothetical protein
MARDENGAALVSEPAKQPAQPADALRVQPVRRFVQHDRPRVSEQRGGQAEALPHPHRVAADLAPCGITQPDQLEHLVGSRHRQAGHRAEDAQVVARRASWVADSSAASTTSVGLCSRWYGRPPMVACPAVGWTRPSTMRSVVVLPAPLGPRKPVTEPGSTVKLSRSTARILPRNTFVKLSTTIRPSRGASVMRTPQ